MQESLKNILTTGIGGCSEKNKRPILIRMCSVDFYRKYDIEPSEHDASLKKH